MLFKFSKTITSWCKPHSHLQHITIFLIPYADQFLHQVQILMKENHSMYYFDFSLWVSFCSAHSPNCTPIIVFSFGINPNERSSWMHEIIMLKEAHFTVSLGLTLTKHFCTWPSLQGLHCMSSPLVRGWSVYLSSSPVLILGRQIN